MISERDIKEFIDKYGKRGEVILERLNEHLPYINEFVKTDIGWQLIKEDVADCKYNIWTAIMATDESVRNEARLKAQILIQRLETRVRIIATWLHDSALIKGDIHDEKMQMQGKKKGRKKIIKQ